MNRTKRIRLGLWQEYCGVLTAISRKGDVIDLEFDNRLITITMTERTRSQIEAFLKRSPIGQPIVVLHTDLSDKPYLVIPADEQLPAQAA